MSMKRSKPRTHSATRRGGESGGAPFNFGDKPEAAAEKSWEEQVPGQPEDAFIAYSLQSTFTKGTLLQHPTFGKGVVIRVEPSRVEVLFSDGKKKLGHKSV